MTSLLQRFDPGDSVLWVATISALIIAVAALGAEALARVFRRFGAATRHDLYLGGLVVILLAPLIVVAVARSGVVLVRWPTVSEATIEVPPVPHPIPAVATRPVDLEDPPLQKNEPNEPEPPVVEIPSPATREPAPIAVAPKVPEPVVAESPPDDRRALAGGLVAVWFIGFVLLLARLTRGMLALGVLRRRLQPFKAEGIDEEIRQTLQITFLPPIFEAPGIPGPVAGGVIRPMVVLPNGMAERLGSDGLRDVLIHECAHVLRRDPLVGLAQRVAALVFWPHPLVHRLNKKLSRAREEACDDLVLRKSDPCGYARTLLWLAEGGATCGRVGPVVGLFETRWKLEDRVAGILERGREPKMPTIRGLKLATIALLALTGAAIAAVRPGEALPVAVKAIAPAIVDEGPGSVITGQVVDEAGAPVAGASVNVTWFRKAREDARTDADGRFTLKIGGPIRPSELVRASIDGDSRIGLAKYEEPYSSRPEPIRIVLKPSRAVVARVVDAAGKPVAGASVEILVAGPIDQGTTDAAGIAPFRVPADAEVDEVVALKNGVGFDVFENYRSWPSSQRDPLPPEMKLVLNGSQSATVRLIDSQGKPVAGVEIGPWFLSKSGKLGDALANGSELTLVKTGEQGLARFDWLPLDLEQAPVIAIRPWSDFIPDSTVIKMDGDRMTSVRVLRNVKLSGKVLNADGSPASGVLIQAESRGRSNLYGRGLARGDVDGSYSVLMPPDQMAMIAVIDPDRAARALTGIVVREGQPRNDLDLRLVEGARFLAKILGEKDGKPLSKGKLTLLYRGIEIPDAFRGPNSTDDRQDLVTWAQADAQGKIERRLGPGDYTILGQENLHVEGSEEIVREFRQSPRDSKTTKVLNGVILDGRGAADKPVADALVRFYQAPKTMGRDLKSVTDATGRYRFESFRDFSNGLVVAREKSGTIAGYGMVADGNQAPKLALAPASTASGRVIDTNGRAIASRRVQLSMTIKIDPTTLFRTYETTRTDSEGRYRFVGLIPGTSGELIVQQEANNDLSGPLSIQKFDVNNSDPIALADIAIPGKLVVIPPVAAAANFTAADVVGANPMPYAIRRSDVEALVRTIGREPVTPEVVDRLAWFVRPEEWWITDLDPIRQYSTDPKVVAMADRASLAVIGKPATTAALVYLAHYYRAGVDVADMKALLSRLPGLKTSPPIDGTIEDAVTGQPIDGAPVFTDSGIAKTDAQGHFRVARSDRRRNLWIEADGYALTEVIPSTDPAKPSKIGLIREQPILGRVLERDSFKPVEGAIVWAMASHTIFLPGNKRDKSDHYGFPLTARTDSQGRFAFRGMPPGVELNWFEVRHPSLRMAGNNVKALKAEEITTLIVEPGCIVAGEVLDESGHPVADAGVALRRQGETSDRYEVMTDQAGRYRFANLGPGPLDLTVQPATQALKRIKVFAEAGRPAINQVVVEAGWTIGGKVVNAKGDPIPGVAVGWATRLDESNNPDPTAQFNRLTYTNGDGRFQLNGLAFGKYRLTVSGQSPQGQKKVDAQVNRPDIIITLP